MLSLDEVLTRHRERLSRAGSSLVSRFIAVFSGMARPTEPGGQKKIAPDLLIPARDSDVLAQSATDLAPSTVPSAVVAFTLVGMRLTESGVAVTSAGTTLTPAGKSISPVP